MKNTLKAFFVGFMATMTFHQAVLYVMDKMNIIQVMAWDYTPVDPFNVPSVLSLAFFGGLWGILSYCVMKKLAKTNGFYYVSQIVFGGIFPTLVAVFVVFQIKGMGFTPMMLVIGFIVNAAWGLGMAVGMKMLNMVK